MAEQTYLITGGAGFIGSNFIRTVLSTERKSRLINFDKLTYAGHLETLENIGEEYPERYRFVRGDICNKGRIDEVFQQEEPDVVVNFAAESHVDRSFKNFQNFIRTNIEGVGNLLEVARNNWNTDFMSNKFLQISTDKVYGSLSRDGSKQNFNEVDPLEPTSPYTASKAAAEHIVWSYRKTFGLPVMVIRSANVFGPYQYPEKLIPLMIYRARTEKKLPIYGDGENLREWIFVKDACRAIRTLLNNGRPGEVYNVGSGVERRNIEVVRKILNYLGKSEELISHIEDRPVHDNRCALDATKIEEDIGWQPQSDFEDKLEYTIDWYLDNTDWVKSVIDGEYNDWMKTNYEQF